MKNLSTILKTTAILLTVCLSLSSFLVIPEMVMASGVPLNGSYTIDAANPTAGTNFQSFNDFAASINTNGISGNVTVTVAPGSGPYQEQVVFDNIQGTGPTATILLEGSGETITAVTTTTDRHVVRLKDVDYFTVNNLHIDWDSLSTGGFYGIQILNTGNFITISNCVVDLSGTSSTLYGAFVASGSETSILVTGDFHDITFSGNTATGGGYGASVFGLLSNLASNIVITGNHFYDFHSNGVYLRETNGAEVSNNHFDKRTSNITSDNAIQVAQAANINTSIFNNFIKVSQVNNGTMTFRGIYLFNGTGHKVYNNVIHDIKLTSGNFTGIEVRTGSTAPQISYNTISIDTTASTTGDLFGISEELSNTNSILRNNLVSISQPSTGNKAALVMGATSTVTTTFNSDHNIFWVPNGNVAMKGSSTPVFYPTLANWQAASGDDANTFSIDPQFTSSSLPVPTNLSADNTGISIPGITTDVLGVLRGPVPDAGAYEIFVTGLTDQENNKQLNLFPNPSASYIRFTLPVNRSEAWNISIYDITGNEVSKINTIFTPSVELEIDVRKLVAGSYFIRAADHQNIYHARFVKL